MAFLDWLASAEGSSYMWCGIEGINYVLEDGRYVQTEDSSKYMNGDIELPAEWGGRKTGRRWPEAESVYCSGHGYQSHNQRAVQPWLLVFTAGETQGSEMGGMGREIWHR